MMMSISPIQKAGMARNMSEKTVMTLSNTLYCRMAEMMPNGMPIKAASTVLMTASDSVVGKREKISSVTGLRVR